MASKVEIINMALTRIGSFPITSVEDDTENARAANRVYDICLKSILGECEWNFAKKRVLLEEIDADDADLAWTTQDESYIYDKPSDIVRIFGNNAYKKADLVMRVEKDYIISNYSGLGIRYVFFEENTDKYSSKFTDAFADILARDLAYWLLNSAPMAEAMFQRYDVVSLPAAKSLA